MPGPAPQFPYVATPAAIDLTTLEAVKDYLATDEAAIVDDGAANLDDTKIQALITALSQYWLTQTSRPSLNSVSAYNEFYDGNGSFRLFLDAWPIVAVSSLQINNVAIPQSTAVGQAGFFIERSRKSLAMRPGGSGTVTSQGYGPQQWLFTTGIGNIAIAYTGGYNGIPNDIFGACTWQVAQAYKRREQINLESMQMGGGAGAATYVKWDWTPEVKDILNSYKKIPGFGN